MTTLIKQKNLEERDPRNLRITKVKFYDSQKNEIKKFIDFGKATYFVGDVNDGSGIIKNSIDFIDDKWIQIGKYLYPYEADNLLLLAKPISKVHFGYADDKTAFTGDVNWALKQLKIRGQIRVYGVEEPFSDLVSSFVTSNIKEDSNLWFFEDAARKVFFVAKSFKV